MLDDVRRPAYAIASVDHALRLIVLLQAGDPVTVTAAAHELGVARSTAHRLLRMLVYRNFARQDEARAYRAGSALTGAEPAEPHAALRELSRPHLTVLAGAVGESAHLAVATGLRTRFVASAECSRTPRIESHEGRVVPAHRACAGLFALASLPAEKLADYVDGFSAEPEVQPDFPRLRRELLRVRDRGFAIGHGLSAQGVSCVGVPVRSADGLLVGGVSISLPTSRFRVERVPALVSVLHRTAGALEADLRPAQ
ncbi:IclR family transcriptional regulator [Nocardioides sp. Kera G14]|uniref:IclR family transcriptional regulator n=1 Tax=Nocardioides sp. Kera G14 TaxID=2884264 RepID=UPI001D11AECC|nr:IclR family transcriptional regulator C-terminal domain-containing protein [Nocardioides sp. Kera G14]UDY23462.1 helix-turn-helix domain-containing protein [Nocardioides sp. Kera G14]